ncbi:MAG: hypothetical protein ACJ79M_02110 [Myxococcales bacterium]
MDAGHLRAFANRDWRAIARAKREHQVRLFREQGAAAMVRIARELFAHARAVNPDWPSEREREADLAHHVELKRALSSVRRR